MGGSPGTPKQTLGTQFSANVYVVGVVLLARTDKHTGNTGNTGNISRQFGREIGRQISWHAQDNNNNNNKPVMFPT